MTSGLPWLFLVFAGEHTESHLGQREVNEITGVHLWALRVDPRVSDRVREDAELAGWQCIASQKQTK